MSKKRFLDCELWQEDWFVDMPENYKLFWIYLITNCDHAGIWRKQISVFTKMNGIEINLDEFEKYINKDKIRIRVVDRGYWLIEDFINFQYGKQLNIKNKVHNSIINILTNNGVNLNSIRGLNEVNLTSKDKDKDKEKDINNITNNINITKEKTELEKTLDDFYKMRNRIKKPMTEKAKEMLLTKLEKLAPNNEQLKIKILNQSIFYAWQGVFELKKDNKIIEPPLAKQGTPYWMDG